jgi:hypothetical protein
MRKINNIYTLLLGGLLALLPAAALAVIPEGITTEPLSGGTTVLLTETGTWQLDDWNKETNIARDLAGNIYMVGTFAEGSTYRPFVKKISPAGVEVWTSTLSNVDNPSSYSDYGRGVAVGTDGSVYSLSVMTRATQDILVVKHNPANGNLLWQQFYDSGDYSDNAYDIVADASYAYVAGTVNNDIAILRFPAAGGAPLVTSFDGGSSYNTDVAYSIAQTATHLAVAGTIYDGRDYNNPSDLEYGNEIWVAKYQKSTMAQIWASTYTSSNHPEWGYDEAHAVKIDDAGNIYAAGFYYSYDSGNDIWLGKYDTNGNLVFARTKNGPSNGNDKGFGLALDAFGNIYVAGKTEAYNLGQGENIWLGKYPPSGGIPTEVTIHRNAEAGYDVEVSTSLVFVGGAFDDKQGVVVVSQDKFGAPPDLFAGPGWYTGSVNLSWIFETDGNYDFRIQRALTANAAWDVADPSNISITNFNVPSDGYNMSYPVNGLPVRLDHANWSNNPEPVYYFKVWTRPNGSTDWTPLSSVASAAPNAPYNYWNTTMRGQDNFWVFSNAYAPSSALVRDSSNNTYIAYGNNMGGVAIVKFGEYGDARWTAFYNHDTINGRFVVNRLKLDSTGNIYAVGTIADQMNPTQTDAWIAKFSPLGVKIWEDVVSGGAEDHFSGIAFDSLGKVYAGGEISLVDGDSAMLLAKYEPAASSPQMIDSVTYNPEASAPEAIWGLAVDGFDTIYAGGYVSVINGSASIYEKDAAIVTFNTSLVQGTASTYGTDSDDYVDGWDAIADLVISGREVYAVGQKNPDTTGTNPVFWVANMDADTLALDWSDTYNSVDNLDAAAYSLKLRNGYLYAAGYENRVSAMQGQQKNMLLRKYDVENLAGGALWTKAIDGTYQDESTLAYSLEAGADGYFYLGGVFNMWGSGEGNPGIARVAEPQSGMAAQPGYKPSSVRLSWVADTELPQGTTFYVHYATGAPVAFNASAAQFSFYIPNMLFSGDYLERLVPGLETGMGAPAPGVNPVNSPVYHFRLGYKRPADETVTEVVNVTTNAVANTAGSWDRADRYPNGYLYLINNAHGGRNPLVRDAAGNIYTAGTFSPWGWGSATAYVRKFNRDGQQLWTRFWSDQYENSNPVINALTISPDGYLYAGGSAGSDGWANYYPYGPESQTKRDGLLIKYALSDGRMQWARTYDFQGAKNNDEIYALAAGPSYLYVAGKFYNAPIESRYDDAVIYALDYNGAPTAYSYVSTRNGNDEFAALAYDHINNRLFAGGKVYGATDSNGLVKGFNTQLGDLEMDINLDGPAQYDEDGFYAVTVDTVSTPNALYIAGAVGTVNGGQDAYLAKYSAGSLEWETVYNSANQNTDEALGLALEGADGQRVVYVSGVEYRYDINQGKNVFVRKYNADGALLWSQALNSATINDDSAGGIAVDGIGGVYAAVDAGSMGSVAGGTTGAYPTSTTNNILNGAGFFKHTQFNMNVVNPRLTVIVSSGTAAGSGVAGVRVAVMGFSSTGGIDPNGIAMSTTSAQGRHTFSLPGGKSYFIAVSSHNMVPTIKDQLSDPGGNFFVDLNGDITKQYYISPRSAAADPVHKLTLNVSTHSGTLAVGDFLMGEVFIMQTGERVGYSVIVATDVRNAMEIYNLPAAANGVYGMAVSVPARNKILQLFMTGAFPAVREYAADMAQASQLAASFEVGGSTVPPSVAGMVLDRNYSPIVGARVRIERSTCAASVNWSGDNCNQWIKLYDKETFSDAGGSFSFYNVPMIPTPSCAIPVNCTQREMIGTQYNINVGKAGYESGYSGFRLPPGTPLPYMAGANNSPAFNLGIATYTLSGILKYNNVPLPNATIMVFPDWNSYSAGNDSYRQGLYGGVGIRTDARARTGADGSFLVTGLTDGNARIDAAFEGGWRSFNQGADPNTNRDDIRVTISASTASTVAPLSPANNPCRPGRVWVINSSGSCVTAGNVVFNIIPEGANNGGQLYGNVTFVTTYTITANTPLVISTSSPLTLMAQESCRDGCQNNQMSFSSLAGTFVSNTTSYSMVLSTGVTYNTRIFSSNWAQANSFKSELSPSVAVPSVRQDFSVVRAGALRGSIRKPDGTNFKPVWGDEDSPTSYWTDVVVQGQNVDTNEDRQLDEYGEFDFPNLSPGTYEVYLRPSGAGFVWAPARQVVTVSEGRTTEVKLQLENGLAVRPQIFGLPEISTASWGYNIIGVPSGTEMNQKTVTELFFSDPEYSFRYSTSTGWATKYMPPGQYDFYLLLGANYDPGGGENNTVSYQLFANFIGRAKGVAVQKSDTNPNIGTAEQPIAINILGSIGQGSISGTIQGANMFTDPDLDRMFANFEQMFGLIPAMMLYDSAGDLRGFSSGMPGSESSFEGFMNAMAVKDKASMKTFLAANPLDYGVWGLPPGRYTAVFNNPNYPPVAKEVLDITAPGADLTAFNFDNEEVVTAGISGVVRSSTTLDLLEGARVYLKHRTVEKFTLTNSSGAFTFSNLPTGIYRLEVTRNGYVTVGRKTSLAANDSMSFAGSRTLYMLPSESKISGRIFMSKFPTQVTKAGVDVVVYDETMNVLQPESYLPKTEAQTDASGNFEITGVVPNHKYKLSVFYTGKLPEVVEVTAREGNTVLGDITLKDTPPQITIKVKKSGDSVNKVDVIIKSPKQLMTAPSCRYNNGQAFDAASAVTLALVPGPNQTYLGQFTISSSQQYYTVKVTAGDAGNKMEKEFVYDQVSNAKTEQYIQQESLAGGAVQMDTETEEYSGIELDPGALSYSTATSGTVDYANLVGGFFSALPSVRTVKTDKGSLTISDAIKSLMASEVYNMDLSNASANKPFTLTLKYDKERGAAKSQNLRIYQQDENGNWVEIPGNYTIDPMLGVLSVDVASLSQASQGASAAATPLGRKNFGMSAVVNGRYVPSAAGTSQSGRFAVFTANPPTGTAAYTTAFEVVNMPNPFNLKSKTVALDPTDIGALAGTLPGGGNNYQTNGTVIKYNLPAGKSGNLKFVIYNLAGEKVRTIDEGSRTGGQIYYSEWDGKNDNNKDCASGVYFMLTYVDGKKLGTKAHKLAVIK